MSNDLCEVRDCSAKATHRISNRRGEGLRVCPAHLAELRAALIEPVVAKLDYVVIGRTL